MTVKQRYLTYDWKLGGNDALFAVDTDLYASAPDKSCDTLVFIFFENKNGSVLSEAERKKIFSLASKYAGKTAVRFAGFIEIPTARQYYAYIDGSKYAEIRQLAEKEKRLTVRTAKKSEPKWTTYFKLLYPDAAKYQTVLNGEQIETLYANGDSAAPRRINLHMYFKNEDLMLQFAREARLNGFAIGDSEIRYENKRPYGVAVRRVCALIKRDVDALTVRAIRLAERFGGELLFWDCPIAPKEQM